MKLSAKTEYACVAMLELAARYGNGEPIRIRDIAEVHGIPSRFLVQILLQLKAAGMVASTRGACGGYQLSRAPADITLADVIAVIEGPIEAPTSNATVDGPAAQVLIDTWREASELAQEKLSDTTLADLVERVEEQSEHMYYI